MKKALVLFKTELQRNKIWHEFKANVHDEWQIECREADADRVGQMGKQAISNVVKELEVLDDTPPNPKKRLRCPLDGEYKIGITWKDTH
jgi:DNA polymerase I-like protein with 3'-5' exonuclease and polymerase domains